MTTPKPPRPKPKPTPPKLIDIARWLFIASAVIGMGRFLVQLSDREMLIDQLRTQQPALGQDELDAAATGGIMFGLLLAAGLVLVYTLLANRMASGRNWARIVLTVLAGVGIFFGLVRLIAVGSGFAAAFGLVVSPVDLAFGGVTMIIDAVAVVLMYLPSVSGYFRSVRSVSVKPPQVANGL
ncbi:hypothetical protein ALI22I_41105 [Saccharothrix sp. ALI-22-I]|uniref:hypothetical protein n=1 Tax=Saccharothrix sp. ALI-22-I TaxID=1933778 RepID=UPI00097BF9D5|nr:hypothetical protein [Saccharothrix sp. ALI-22-I]ONI82471.1 hypothetical protein ALI22I_41105 [Saccharothrix sp. ALI-22-I]